MTLRADSRLERVLHDQFAVTAEAVPPKSADPEAVRAQARALVGYADSVNVTDSPTGSAHMSTVAMLLVNTVAAAEAAADLPR
jgi:5,10-methylenetetrahydrofolate reductase